MQCNYFVYFFNIAFYGFKSFLSRGLMTSLVVGPRYPAHVSFSSATMLLSNWNWKSASNVACVFIPLMEPV